MNMALITELEKRYPILMGHSVIVIDSPKTANELFAYLSVNQEMKVDFVNEVDFPNDLAQYMGAKSLESSILHVPGVATNEGANFYKSNVFRAYKQQPRMIILEGFPVNRETVDMYRDFRKAGIAMADKISLTRIVGKLADLFT